MHRINRGLTLVELIITISIITTLSTIALVSYSSFAREVRDAKRKTDIQNIVEASELHKIFSWVYPSVSEWVDITYSGSTIWTQGTFGRESQVDSGKIHGDLIDPKYKNEYTYSLTQSRREYQLWVVFEQDSDVAGIIAQWEFSFIPQTHALIDVTSFDPRSVWNIHFWFDGKDINGDFNLSNNPSNGTVRTWRDKSWDNHSITQATSWDRPRINSSEDSLIFTKWDYLHFWTVDSSWDANYRPYSNSDDFTLFAVWKTTGEDGIDSVFWNNGFNQRRLYLNSDGMVIGSDNNFSYDIAGKWKSLSSFDVDNSADSGNGLQRYFVNGWLQSQLSTSSLLQYNPTITSIPSIVQNLDGEVYEVIWYFWNLSESDRRDIEWYLAHRWGIADQLPLDHPYTTQREVTVDTDIAVFWNYNGVLVHSEDENDVHYVVATPSIISTDTSVTDIETIIWEQLLAFDGYLTVPASYNASEVIDESEQFWYTPDSPIIFTWSRSEITSYVELEKIDTRVRYIYEDTFVYPYVSNYLDDIGLDYLVDILSNSVGINPLKPFYCKNILENKLATNIAPYADVSAGSLWLLNGYGILSITDGDTSTEGNNDYSYHSDPGDQSWIELDWSWVAEIGLVRIHNRTQEYSERLSAGKVMLLDGEDTVLHTYTLWDTQWVFVIDIDYTKINLDGWLDDILADAEKIRIETADINGDILNIREVEVFEEGWLISGIYKVDDDGVWWLESYNVYCDMSTEWGWWTRLWDNLISRSYFADQIHPDEYTLSDAASHTIRSDITPPVDIPETNILRQIWGNNIKYEMYFDNIPNIEFTSEIRLTAWVKWTSNSIFSHTVIYGENSVSSRPDPLTLEVKGLWEKQMVRIPITDIVTWFYWNIWDGISTSWLDVTWLEVEVFYK